jgi:hypothetical protein
VKVVVIISVLITYITISKGYREINTNTFEFAFVKVGRIGRVVIRVRIRGTGYSSSDDIRRVIIVGSR